MEMSIGYSLDRVLVVMVVCAVLFSCTSIHAKKCGYKPTQMGITNGEDAYENEFPWQVLLHSYGKYSKSGGPVCGGAIISDYWVITAAHCVDDATWEKSYYALVGANKLKERSEYEKMIKVKKVYIHPGWDAESSGNDIALLKLKHPVGLKRSNLNAICLGSPEHDTEGMEAVISGWGTLSEDAERKVVEVLQRATVIVENQEVCRRLYTEVDDFDITNGDVCAGRESGTCYGDSGGPLQYEIDGRWYLLGVTSWGHVCASHRYPSVYARVPYFLDFIESVTGLTTPDFELYKNQPGNLSKNILKNFFVNLSIRNVSFTKQDNYNFRKNSVNLQ